MNSRQPASTGVLTGTLGDKRSFPTTGVFLLRLLYHLRKSGKSTVRANELIDQVFLGQLGQKLGVRIYDLAPSRDGRVQSDRLMGDVAALSAAKFLKLEGDDVRMTLTEEGLRVADAVRASDVMEKVLPEIVIER